MPRMHCMGTSLEIPDNGQICPKLPTNMVPNGQKCEIVCDSGTPNVESIKCEPEGWSVKEVYCSGTSAGLIVGLLVGGIIVVCIIAYVYARMKQRRANKAKGAKTGNKSQPLSRAAKIAARNDMVVTGVVTREAVKTGAAKPVSQRNTGKLVTGDAEPPAYRHPSNSSQLSNPPSYHSYEWNEERSHNSTPTKGKGRRSRNSNSDRSASQRKHRQYFEETNLPYHEGLSPTAPPPMDDQYHHHMPDTVNAHHDYYPPNGGHDPYPMEMGGHHQGHHGRQGRHGAINGNYYGHADGQYDDRYMEGGIDNMAYSHGSASYHKPYRVPI